MEELSTRQKTKGKDQGQEKSFGVGAKWARKRDARRPAKDSKPTVALRQWDFCYFGKSKNERIRRKRNRKGKETDAGFRDRKCKKILLTFDRKRKDGTG